MCVPDCGVGFEEERESGAECECGLSEAKKGGSGHLNQPLRHIVLPGWCGRGSRSVALTEGSARTFGWQRSLKFL